MLYISSEFEADVQKRFFPGPQSGFRAPGFGFLFSGFRLIVKRFIVKGLIVEGFIVK